jgi:hypothetical protein
VKGHPGQCQTGFFESAPSAAVGSWVVPGHMIHGPQADSTDHSGQKQKRPQRHARAGVLNEP